MASLVWFIIFLTFLLHCTYAKPPPAPVTCDETGCALHNSYGAWGDRKACRALTVTYPTTEEEIRLIVAEANQKKQKIKVVTKFSHTIPKLACPDSTSAATVLISTAMYNTGIEIDNIGMTVTADSGVGLRDLIDKVEAAGLSLVAAPYWEGVSIGGLISTGAHGSSWWGKGGAVHDHVVGINLVIPAKQSDGYAKVIKIDNRNPVFNAVKVSLGLLGVISKVTLSLEPGFKRSITNVYNNDNNFENEFIDVARKHEFADINWYPSRQVAVYRYDDRVPLNTSGEGINDYIGFQTNSVLISMSVRAAEKALETARNVDGKCAMATSVVGFKKLSGNGLKNNLIFTGYPVVGRQGRMQTSGSCLHSSPAAVLSTCAWDPRIKGLFFYETTAIFPASKFRDFIKDVKKLRDLNINNFCGVDVYNGFLIRFIKASNAYLGQSEDSVVVDFNYYRADDASTPRLNQDIWEEIEQMAFFKYGAKPHWAKNRNLAFLGVQQKYPNLGKFLAVKKQLDPDNIFSSDWSDNILFGKETTKGDECALEGQCICSEDRHCSPDKGYFCKPGLIYTQAHVCRYMM
ncbi:L-gulonolactone oxidase 3 [Ranunculus cassubicifolius]